jgi:hypothetical protein
MLSKACYSGRDAKEDDAKKEERSGSGADCVTKQETHRRRAEGDSPQGCDSKVGGQMSDILRRGQEYRTKDGDTLIWLGEPKESDAAFILPVFGWALFWLLMMAGAGLAGLALVVRFAKWVWTW